MVVIAILSEIFQVQMLVSFHFSMALCVVAYAMQVALYCSSRRKVSHKQLSRDDRVCIVRRRICKS